MQKSFAPTKRFIALMSCLTGLTALGIDSVLPIFPEMIDYYQLPAHDHNRIQQVVFVYMLGFFQLLFGILADTVGRKPLLLIGIGIYALAALSVVFIDHFDNVLLARFIQGAGLAAPRVLTMTIVRDISSGKQMSRIMSFIMMVFLCVPAVAPMLGQVVVIFAPWQGVFVMLTVLGVLLLLWVYHDMPETLAPENKRPFTGAQLKLAIAEFLSNKTTLFHMLMISALFASLMMYVAQSEQIMQKDIYRLGRLFPLAFATIILGMVGAAVTNTRFVGHWGVKRMLRLGIVILIVTDVLFITAVVIMEGTIPLPGFILAIMGHFFGFGLVMPNANTLAMAPYQHIAGTASALIGMVTSVSGVLLAQAVSSYYQKDLFAIASGFGLCLTMVLLAYWLSQKHTT